MIIFFDSSYQPNFLIWIAWLIIFLSWLPTSCAQDPTIRPFPNPTFQVFSNFILSTFGPQISLTSTLLILFSLIENPYLLNLHERQTHPQLPSEKTTRASSWMKFLAQGILEKVPEEELLVASHSNTQRPTVLAQKLDGLVNFLDISPYDTKTRRFKGKISSISQ